MTPNRFERREIEAGRFVVAGDAGVADTKTGLVWAPVDSGLEDRSGKPDGESWQEAIAYCEAFCGGGHDDWRMPTLSELKELHAAFVGSSAHELERDFWSTGAHPGTGGGDASACYRGHDVPVWIDSWIWSSDVRGSDAATFYFHSGKVAWDAQSFRDWSLRALPVRVGSLRR